MRTRGTAVALTVVMVVAIGACGGSSKHSHSSDHAGNQPTTRSTTKTVTAPAASRPLVTVDAVQQARISGHYRLTIYDLRREGPYVVLDFGIGARRRPASAAIRASTSRCRCRRR